MGQLVDQHVVEHRARRQQRAGGDADVASRAAAPPAVAGKAEAHRAEPAPKELLVERRDPLPQLRLLGQGQSAAHQPRQGVLPRGRGLAGGEEDADHAGAVRFEPGQAHAVGNARRRRDAQPEPVAAGRQQVAVPVAARGARPVALRVAADGAHRPAQQERHVLVAGGRAGRGGHPDEDPARADGSARVGARLVAYGNRDGHVRHLQLEAGVGRRAQAHRRERKVRSVRQPARLKATTPLWPPKPKLLESAARIGAATPRCGT